MTEVVDVHTHRELRIVRRRPNRPAGLASSRRSSALRGHGRIPRRRSVDERLEQHTGLQRPVVPRR
jgi:hypothetical protein